MGVCYVAYGHPARTECQKSIDSLRHWHDWPVAVVGDRPLEGAEYVYAPDRDAGGRMAKLNLDRLSPYDPTLYLDADTRVRGDIGAPFAALADGWDLAIAPSPRQHSDALGNCSEPDRQATWEECGCNWLLALQGGALWFCKSEPILRLFAAWREEWARYKSKDQAALLRALWRAPVRVWLLGGDYNGGQLVSHLYGRAAR